RSAIAIQDGPRSKMLSLACWLPLSLLAPDRYGETEHLFPVREETVADLEASLVSFLAVSASAGNATSTAWIASCPGSSQLAAVRGEPEALLGPGVLELNGTPLVVEVLDLRDHQADAV